MNNLINQIRDKYYQDANSFIKQISGIVNYFSSEEEKDGFVSLHEGSYDIVSEDRASYGDWQTPRTLADRVCENHIAKYGSPDIVIEPTCGLGAFVFSVLDKFRELTEIHAIEINRQYVSELKFRLLLNALGNPMQKRVDIYIYNADFFEFDFSEIIGKAKNMNKNLAIIGNPPWVTNSNQGKNNSKNVPFKQNYFGLKGIDAITGKSNFDISEYITLHLLRLSQHNKGGISFLLKNSVIRSILMKQKADPVCIGDIEQGMIDASSEFNVSVDASCFSARFDSNPSMHCNLKDFYNDMPVRAYGWVNESFVSDMELYQRFAKYDNRSAYVWRSGIKHDCASVLELTLVDGEYLNGFGETVRIEEDLIFPLLKSSDINNYQVGRFRKFIIVPQHKTGESTSLLKYTHPLAYSYLVRHESVFSNRKSSIYKGKDRFSIFGVGDYSFKPYKIVVSSLYKSVNFTLVSLFEGRPIMVDDTCYQLDFEDREEAMCLYNALNSEEIQSLLKSLIFFDAKRVVTKSLLMRLDLAGVCRKNGVKIDSNRFNCSLYKQLPLFD